MNYANVTQTVASFRANKMRTSHILESSGESRPSSFWWAGKGFSEDQHKRMKSLGKDLVIIWVDARVCGWRRRAGVRSLTMTTRADRASRHGKE